MIASFISIYSSNLIYFIIISYPIISISGALIKIKLPTSYWKVKCNINLGSQHSHQLMCTENYFNNVTLIFILFIIIIKNIKCTAYSVSVRFKLIVTTKNCRCVACVSWKPLTGVLYFIQLCTYIMIFYKSVNRYIGQI